MLKLKTKIITIHENKLKLDQIYSDINSYERQDNYSSYRKIELYLPNNRKVNIEKGISVRYSGVHIDQWLNDSIYTQLNNTGIIENLYSKNDFNDFSVSSATHIINDYLLLMGPGIYLYIPNSYDYFKKVIMKLIERF